MHSMKDAMLKAIKDKRGQGLDIKIILGQHEDQNDKTKDTAPDAPMIDETEANPMEGSPKEESIESMIEKLKEGDVTPDANNTKMDEEMMSHMGNEPMPQHKPRSLGERAKMALMTRMKK